MASVTQQSFSHTQSQTLDLTGYAIQSQRWMHTGHSVTPTAQQG